MAREEAKMKLWKGTQELTDLGHVQQYFQIHQQFIDISVEDHKLSLAKGEPLVRVWRGDHAALASPKEPVAGQLHIQCQAAETNRKPLGSRSQASRWGNPFSSLWWGLNNRQSP